MRPERRLSGGAHLRSERLAVMGWLSTILHERFSDALRLDPIQPGWVCLSLPGSPVTIQIQSMFETFDQARSDLPCAHWAAARENWQPALGSDIPAPGISVLPEPLIERAPQGYLIHYDILGLAYWMMSRKEEVGRTDLDIHMRFPASASHASRHGYLERPIVDEWFHILAQVMMRAWPALPLAEHHFQTLVSHDVDGPSWYTFSTLPQLIRTIGGDLFIRHMPLRALKAPVVWAQARSRLHESDPANTFGWLMSTSEKRGLASAFYFICGRTDACMDAQYEPEHPAIRALMREIHSRGHEIGLHPSYNTFQQPSAIAAEAQRLDRICEEEAIDRPSWGGRMHFLRWETPTTLYGWEQAGAAYDSSLGYADRPGFRCGTCFEYPAFDPARYAPVNLRIRPLIAMEVTVMGSNYLGLGTGEAACAKFMQLKNACRAVNGNFTLLWHNSELETPECRALYTSILE